MLSVTREKGTWQVRLAAEGLLDVSAVRALLGAVLIAPDTAPVVIDLSQASAVSAVSLRDLLAALAPRPGPVVFRMPKAVRDQPQLTSLDVAQPDELLHLP